MEETGSHRRDHCNGTHGTEGGTQIFKTPSSFVAERSVSADVRKASKEMVIIRGCWAARKSGRHSGCGEHTFAGSRVLPWRLCNQGAQLCWRENQPWWGRRPVWRAGVNLDRGKC